MSISDHLPRPTDEELVAFIDGELDVPTRTAVVNAVARDAEVARRLAELEAAGASLREGFARLLDEAPAARMEARLSRLTTLPASPSRPARQQFWRYAGLAAAALVLVSAGVAIDRTVVLVRTQPATEGIADRGDDWRDAVALYFSLYTDDTFSAAASADAERAALDRVNRKLGLQLSPADVSLPAARFAGTALFGYEGRPLAQIAYVDPRSGPVALCIIASEEADRRPRAERRQGMNVVYWTKDHRAYMLVGRAPSERLQQYAGLLEPRT